MFKKLVAVLLFLVFAVSLFGETDRDKFKLKGFVKNYVRWIHDENDAIVGKMIIVFDVNGNMIEEIRYDIKGIMQGKRVFIYDKYGNKIAEHRYNSVGIITKQIAIGDYTYHEIQTNYYGK